jgi:hypothetical protein
MLIEEDKSPRKEDVLIGREADLYFEAAVSAATLARTEPEE